MVNDNANIRNANDNPINSCIAEIAIKQLEAANSIHLEAEKIKTMLHKLKESSESCSPSLFKELVNTNNNAERTLANIISEEMLLLEKLKKVKNDSTLQTV